VKIQSVWDFIDSDCESVGASSTRSDDLEGVTSDGLPDIQFKHQVPSEQFEEPCIAVAVQGGTAAFFFVRYRPGQEPEGKEAGHFVGKDLAHASDELQFYETLVDAKEVDSRFADLAESCMDCPGVARLICRNPKDNSMQVRFLLLLENLWNGYDKMRLVDVKMGAETSVANWKGKSRLHAWKNAKIDQRTNSLVEGFRLEGMECPPRALEDRILAVNENSNSRMRSKIISGKAAKRFLLQRLRAHEFMAAWCDVSALGVGAEQHSHGAVWSAVEQVGKLLRVCSELPVPQQWIGSSIAMGLEIATMSSEPKVTIKVFDWGRAELVDVNMFKELSAEAKKERWKFWRQYCTAVTRFYWELCRIATHRCCCCSWTAFVFELRIEPVSILRAALLGAVTSEVRGIGLFQLPAAGIKSGSASIVLPLVAPKGVATRSGDKNMIGALHTKISTPSGGRCGEGSTLIEVRGATQLPTDLDTGGGAITVVRVIGFERVGDARMHCEKYRGGHPEPAPRGRAYAHNTSPGKIIAGTMVWEANFEFVGLAAKTPAARRRLQELMPEVLGPAAGNDRDRGQTMVSAPSSGGLAASFPISPVVSNVTTSTSLSTASKSPSSPEGEARDHSPWPEMLPPTIGDQSQIESVSQVFATHLIPWLDESHEHPSAALHRTL